MPKSTRDKLRLRRYEAAERFMLENGRRPTEAEWRAIVDAVTAAFWREEDAKEIRITVRP
jgi:hypothetical protein